MFILDGHAHLYPDELAQKVVGRFTEFHRMNPRVDVVSAALDFSKLHAGNMV